MIRWDNWRSFLLWADRSFTELFDRLPPWGQMLLFPPAVLFMMVAWASYFPRTTAAAAVTVVAVYVPLIRSGVIPFSWGGALSYLGTWCLGLMGSFYALLLAMWLVLWPLSRWMSGKQSPEGPRSTFSLWDREIDG
jgi:hypothetical protein